MVEATIAEISAMGSLDVTVGKIAKRAGMSSALAHHYFGSKTQIFLAAMRHVLSQYGADVRRRLAQAENGKRFEAIIAANFDESSRRHEAVIAWLNFFVLAQTNPDAARLLRLYQRRLRSNLIHALRGRCADPDGTARIVAALIDGVYLRAVMPDGTMDDATDRVLAASYAVMNG